MLFPANRSESKILLVCNLLREGFLTIAENGKEADDLAALDSVRIRSQQM